MWRGEEQKAWVVASLGDTGCVVDCRVVWTDQAILPWAPHVQTISTIGLPGFSPHIHTQTTHRNKKHLTLKQQPGGKAAVWCESFRTWLAFATLHNTELQGGRNRHLFCIIEKSNYVIIYWSRKKNKIWVYEHILLCGKLTEINLKIRKNVFLRISKMWWGWFDEAVFFNHVCFVCKCHSREQHAQMACKNQIVLGSNSNLTNPAPKDKVRTDRSTG